MGTEAFTYDNGSAYNGNWNDRMQRHGYGHLKINDKFEYWGIFYEDLFSGKGNLIFKDGSKYEGDFKDGRFDGYGIFTRYDGMKFEGEYRDGKMNGHGLLTFSNNLTRNEGYFEGNTIIRRENCPAVIEKANISACEAKSLRV